MTMIKGLLTLLWSNDHSAEAGGEAPDTDTSSASSPHHHHLSLITRVSLAPGLAQHQPSVCLCHHYTSSGPGANYDLAPSGWEEKSEWEHRNTILDLTWKIRIECGPPGGGYNAGMIGMMQKLAEISDGDHSGLGQESLHMVGSHCYVERNYLQTEGSGPWGQHQTTAECSWQHCATSIPSNTNDGFWKSKTDLDCKYLYSHRRGGI